MAGFHTATGTARLPSVLLALCLVILLPLLSRCGDFSFRQKVVVTVPTRGGGFRLSDEAPVVKLGGRRHLVALVDGMDAKLHGQFAGSDGRGVAVADTRAAILAQTTPLALAPDAYPLLVTFGNVGDPASVQQVDPPTSPPPSAPATA